jgi:hypothetical protein
VLGIRIAISAVAAVGCLWNRGQKQLPHRAWLENKAVYELHKDQASQMDEHLRRSIHEPRKKRYGEISRIAHLFDIGLLLFLGAVVLPWVLDGPLTSICVPVGMIVLAVVLLLFARARFFSFLDLDQD